MKQLLQQMNKKAVGVIGLVFIIVVVLMIIIIPNGNKNKLLTCTRSEEPVEGITIDETLKFDVKKEKIAKITGEKRITLSAEYTKYPTFYDIFKDTLKKSYAYVPEKDLTIDQKDATVKASFTTDQGVILNNIDISILNPKDKYDLSINTQNNFDAASTSYKIGDEYSPKNLKKKIEEYGYICK